MATSKTRTQQATEALIEFIADRKIRVGDTLPPEPELAAALGVGRNSLREAVSALKGLRILESRQGSGVRLSATSPVEAAGELLRLYMRTASADPAELYFLRRTLELGVIDRAVTQATEEDCAAITQRAEQMESEIRKPRLNQKRILRADLAFHRAITAPADYVLLSALNEALEQFFRIPWPEGRDQDQLRSDLEQTALDHRMITGAFITRQPQTAFLYLSKHLESYDRMYGEKPTGS